jgi:hypothetical protein
MLHKKAYRLLLAMVLQKNPFKINLDIQNG